jgi:hypothetical protein
MVEHGVPGVAVVDAEDTLRGSVQDGYVLESDLPKYLKVTEGVSFGGEDAGKWVH